MIQAAIGGLILLGIYKFMNSNSEYEITWWMAFVFILVPGLLLLLIKVGLGLLNLSQVLLLFAYVFYFIIPFLILKHGLEFEQSPAIKFSAVVPIVAIVTEIPFALLLSAGNA